MKPPTGWRDWDQWRRYSRTYPILFGIGWLALTIGVVEAIVQIGHLDGPMAFWVGVVGGAAGMGLGLFIYEETTIG